MLRFSIAVLLCATTACSGVRSVRQDVYRAPQMHEHLLAQTVRAHGIRSIVGLRGPGRNMRSSARAALGTDATFWNVPMSAMRLPPPSTLLALWDVAARAERPLLLHCRAGVDRTGLASAIVVLHDTGDLKAAEDQLDLIPYGHVAWSRAGAMDEVLERFAPHAAAGMPFPEWVQTIYAADFTGR